MRILMAIAFLGTTLLSSGGGAHAAAPVAETVKAVPSIRAGSRPLSRGDSIFLLDRISTAAGGSGEFIFQDGTKLAVGPSASIVIDQSIAKSQSTFQKLGLSALRGSFRWISGSSPSKAYAIKTPTGVMAVRGTAFDVTIRGGRTHIVLLSGSARFCAGSACQSLKSSCDYVSIGGGGISEVKPLSKAFKSRNEAAALFPFVARPGSLSPRFRVGSGACLGKTASNSSDSDSVGTSPSAGPSPPGGGEPPSGGGESDCGGSCGKGNNGNGTGNEGKGKGPKK